MKKIGRVMISLAVGIGSLTACSLMPYKEFKRFPVTGHNLVESVELPSDFHSVPSNQDIWPGSVSFGRDNSPDLFSIEAAKKFDEKIEKGQDVEIDGRTVRLNKWFGDSLSGHIAKPTFQGSIDYSALVPSTNSTNYFVDISFAGCEHLDCDRVVRSIHWKKTEP